MKKTGYIIWIAAMEAVGFLSALVTARGMLRYSQTAVKPPLTPPGIVFAAVWIILFGLMGFSGARISSAPDSACRGRGLNWFVIQLVLNFFWSLIFFNGAAYGAALLWLGLLWISVLKMILLFGRVERIAAVMQIPYLLWVTFAGWLNFGVWWLNP